MPIWILSALGLVIIATVGDLLIKLSSQKPGHMALLLIAAVLYASTAFGWFFVFRHLKLADVGAYFALFSTLFLVLLGTFYFHEKLNGVEILGIALALISIILLARFS